MRPKGHGRRRKHRYGVFFFFSIFRKGRVVILAIFMDFHLSSFFTFLDLSLIKNMN